MSSLKLKQQGPAGSLRATPPQPLSGWRQLERPLSSVSHWHTVMPDSAYSAQHIKYADRLLVLQPLQLPTDVSHAREARGYVPILGAHCSLEVMKYRTVAFLYCMYTLALYIIILNN